MTKLPPITKKQQTILLLISHFRFLDRTQIQKYLKHKDEARSNAWLKDLIEKEYIGRLYTRKFPENTKPAVYYIAKNGIAFLKSQNGGDVKSLHKYYFEKDRTGSFIESCLLIFDIYFDLSNRKSGSPSFNMTVSSDYTAHPFADLLAPLRPSGYIEQKQSGKSKQYLLEILADFPPEIIRRRIKQYLNLYQSSEWEELTENPFPTILIACPNNALLNYLKRYIKSKLNQLDEPDLKVHLSTAKKVREFSLTGDIWTEVRYTKYE